jgi:tRNA G18 (ribose-2'-O)-methylase SpoU
MNRHDRNLQARYQKERQRNVLAQPGELSFIIVLDNLKPGFNVAKIFRSAEAFGAASVWLVGIGPFDPAPAKGSFRKVPARFFELFSDCQIALQEAGYQQFMLDTTAETLLTKCCLPLRSAFIFGHDEFGCSFKPDEYPGIMPLKIPQFGSVQSLNVSIAASITMYEYMRQATAASCPHQGAAIE